MANTERDYDAPIAAAATAAGGTPFLGMVGERRIVHDPHLNKNIKRVGLHELERRARPGDVILSSRPGWEGFKITQAPLSGSEFFHASPVYGRRRGKGTVIDAGDLAEWRDYKPTIKEVSPAAKTVRRHFPEHGYADLVLMRPEKELSPKELRALRKSLTSRAYEPYSVPKGAKAALKDLFVPKLKQVAQTPTPVCVGSMCSALPAEAMAESGVLRHISKGKAPGEVLPADFLRSGSGFKPVAAVTGQKRVLGPVSRQLYRLGGRAALGAGIGGTLYGTYKDPVTTAGILGGVATPLAVRAGAEAALRRFKHMPKPEASLAVHKQLPTIRRLLMEAFTPDPTLTPEAFKKLKWRLGLRTLPLMAAGGVGTYLMADKLRDLISQRVMKSTPEE